MWWQLGGSLNFARVTPEEGRALYRRSLEIARANNDEKGKLARVYLALEELRIGSADAEESRRQAIEATSGLAEPWCQTLVDRLREYRAPRRTEKNADEGTDKSAPSGFRN